MLIFSYLCGKIDSYGTGSQQEFEVVLLYSRGFRDVWPQREYVALLGKEFPYLKPKNSGPAKIRQYQERDIEQIRLIHNLVKVRGFKLAAAKKIINANRDGADRKAEVLSRLIDIRSELQTLKKKMDYLT